MGDVELSDLLTGVVVKPNTFTEIEVKFKPKTISSFIQSYQNVLMYMKNHYPEIIEESTVYSYDQVREIVINRQSSFERKVNLKNVDTYAPYGFIISISEETKLKHINTRNLRRTFTRHRTRHRFDLGNDYELDMTEIKVKDGKIIYEIELEYVGNIRNFTTDSLEEQIKIFYKLIYGSDHIYTHDMIKYLQDDTYKILGIPLYKVLPKARNIKFPDLTYGSIVGGKVGYVVSHKADGLHKFLVQNKDGLWLVHNDDYNHIHSYNYPTTSIYDTEHSYNYPTTSIYDTEVLQNGTILVYDCIAFENKNLMMENLDEREKYIEHILMTEPFVIKLKPNRKLTLENFFIVMNEMVDEQETLDFPQDGFIFTPTGQYNYGSDKLPLYKRKLLHHPDICKWKPPNRITIDFRVGMIDGIISLYVYDAAKRVEVPFDVPLSQDFYTDYNLYDNMIVECIYDPICHLMTPIKVRYDKKLPNQLDIARSNWNDINDPITIDDLCGNSLTLVTKYQNQIKNMLYGIETIYPPIEGLVIPKNYNLLDIGGGRGGDLSKWEKSGASTIITIEPNQDNLAVLKQRLSGSRLRDHVFAVNAFGEDTKLITQEVHKYVNNVDAVSLMLSLSFFYGAEENLDALVQTIIHNLAQDGQVLFLTIDGEKLEKHLTEPLHLLNTKYTLYDNKFVRAEIPGIVGKQWEFLVSIPKLQDKLSPFGIELITSRPATDELLLSKEAQQYTSLFTYGYFKKVKDINPGKLITYTLPTITYPTIDTILLEPLEDDDSQPIPTMLYNNVVRIGANKSLVSAILKATYEPYQNASEEEDKKNIINEAQKELNTTNVNEISNILNIDIYVMEHKDNDLILASSTYDCSIKSYSIILLHIDNNIDNSYEVIALNTKSNLLKTNYDHDDVFLYHIKQLLNNKEREEPIEEITKDITTQNIKNIPPKNISSSTVPSSTIKNVPSSTIKNVPSSTIKNVPSSTIKNVPSSTVKNIPSSVIKSTISIPIAASKVVLQRDDFYIQALLNNIRKAYQVPNKNTKEYKQLKNKLTTIINKNNTDEFITLLKNLTSIPDEGNIGRIKERVSNLDIMLQKAGFQEKKVVLLDIGAGNGDITKEVKKHFHLRKDQIYALDQKLPTLYGITTLTYDKDGNIPLKNDSVNVIILYAVLHHIPPGARLKLMKEIARILEPGGVVVIREHDDDNDTMFYRFINYIHLLWYISRGETEDPLYMLSRAQFDQLFNEVGLKSVYFTTYEEPNAQHLYHEVFQKPYNEQLVQKYDREASRYHTIHDMLLFGEKTSKHSNDYELKNIMERWLLTTSQLPNKQDEVLTISSENTNTKMLQEMKDKKIQNDDTIYEYIIKNTNEWLSKNIYEEYDLPIVNDDTITINKYQRTLPPGKLDILLSMNDSLILLGTMIMRYASLLIGGQQWALPIELHRYMVDNYQVTIEGFASPINSQILNINTNLHYCSLFYDTDAIYGSLGSFFQYSFDNCHVYANPPYVDAIMNATADKIIDACNNATNFVRFFITVPEWTDAEYYHKLLTSEYLVYDYGFVRGKHYYVDTNDGYKKIPTIFNTHLFVLAVNVQDDYTKFVQYANNVFTQNNNQNNLQINQNNLQINQNNLQNNITNLINARQNELNDVKTLLTNEKFSQLKRNDVWEQSVVNYRRYITRTLKGQNVTKAWLKMYEMLTETSIGEYLLQLTDDVHCFFNAELPGGFIYALNHYFKNKHHAFDWVISSYLPENTKDKDFLSDDFQLLSKYPNNALVGNIKNTWIDGDLTNPDMPDILAKLAKSILGDIHLYTADGGFDVQGNENQQEELTLPLIRGEIECGLLSLAKGGVMIIKIFTFFTPQMFTLLVYLTRLFESYDIFKPQTSGILNSESYFIGIGYKNNMNKDNIKQDINDPNTIYAIPTDQENQYLFNKMDTLTNNQITNINTFLHGKTHKLTINLPITPLKIKDKL